MSVLMSVSKVFKPNNGCDSIEYDVMFQRLAAFSQTLQTLYGEDKDEAGEEAQIDVFSTEQVQQIF